MKMLNKVLFCTAGALLMASSVQAQTVTIGDVVINEGAATADVPWNFAPGNGATSWSVDIPDSVGILTGVDLTDCIQVEDADLQACVNNGGTVRITLTNFVDPLGVSSGILRFSIDPAAVDGNSAIVDAEPVPGGEAPPGTVIIVDDGSVTVTAVSAILNVTPANINFGNQQTGTTSAPQSVTVSNDGTDGVDLTISAITPTGDFNVSGGTCIVGTTLADGADCTVDVTFSPAADGAAAGTLVIASDAGTTTNDTVALEGTGTPGPTAAFSITPNTAAFGTVDLGNMPQSIVHTVENTGDAGSTLDLNSVVYNGDAEFSISATTCGASLAAGATCTVTVTFNAAANGNYTGSVDVSTNVGDFSVPVTGTADSVPALTVNPPFGGVFLGNGAAGDTVSANGTLTNNGSADGDFTCTLGGPDAAVFSTTPSPLSGTVTAGGSVPFTLSCALPGGAADGDTFNATLTCSSTADANFAGTHELSCGVQTIEFIPVPTMKPWSLVLFSMLMLIAGGLGIRFFRA